MRLIEASTGRVVWSTSGDAGLSVVADAREVREVVRRLAVRIAQPYGVLHADLREHSPPGAPTRCTIKAYDYWIAPAEPLHAQVRDCLEQITRANPGFHPAWSLLAMITLDEHRIGYNVRPDPLPRAVAAAQRAVQLAPESARAQQALMAVLTVSGEIGEALKTGFDAVRRNPYDTDILADVGARLTQAGRGREGRPLLERAADLNQARPPWHEFYRFLAARQAGDMSSAKALTRFLQGSDAPLALLGSIVAGIDAGRHEDAARALRGLRRVSPTFAANPGEFLDRSFFAPEVREEILGVIEKASRVVAGG
jgi:tetratricopeptide (TPR) repeat protein